MDVSCTAPGLWSERWPSLRWAGEASVQGTERDSQYQRRQRAICPARSDHMAYLVLGFDRQGSIKDAQNKVKSLSRVQLFATPWTVAYQAPPSMGFSRQEYQNGLPFLSPGDLPNPGTEPRPPTL